VRRVDDMAASERRYVRLTGCAEPACLQGFTHVRLGLRGGARCSPRACA
jgi:hypothetical protein